MTRTDEPTLNEALGITPAALTGLDQPLWLQNSSYPAAVDRSLIETTFSAGIIGPADLAVTQRAAGANMSVDVAAGRVVVTMTDAPNQGRALCRSTAVNNLTIPGAPAAGLTRIDLIVARVYDTSIIGGSINGWQLDVVAGTAASSPTVPAVPASAIALAEVRVPAGTASVTNAIITDRRVQSYTHTGVARFPTSAARTAAMPSPVLNQMSILDSRPGVTQFWNGTAWTDTAPFIQSGIASGTTNTGAFLSFGYPIAFAATPQIIVQNIVQQVPYLFTLFPPSSSAGQAAFTMHLPSGAGANSTAYSLYWIAVGSKI